MKHVVILIIVAIAVFCIAFSDAKTVTWGQKAKKAKFCTKLCKQFKGALLGGFRAQCTQKCRIARDKAVVVGNTVKICDTLCTSVPALFGPYCKKNCPVFVKGIPVPGAKRLIPT